MKVDLNLLRNDVVHVVSGKHTVLQREDTTFHNTSVTDIVQVVRAVQKGAATELVVILDMMMISCTTSVTVIHTSSSSSFHKLQLLKHRLQSLLKIWVIDLLHHHREDIPFLLRVQYDILDQL